MLRHVVTSPDGSRVVYSALGHLYIKRLPDGEPARLTTSDAIEAFPVVLARRPLDCVRRMDRQGRRAHPRHLARRRRGTRRRHGAGSLRRAVLVARRTSDRVSRRWARHLSRIPVGHEPGLFVADADGAARRASFGRMALEPQFDHTGTRIYFRDSARREVRPRAACRVDGGDEQVHLQSDNATQIVPSPDGRWVAFAERYHAFVAAVPAIRPPGGYRPQERGISRREDFEGRRPLSALVGRQPHRALGAWTGALQPRSLAHVHIPRSALRQRPRSLNRRVCRSASLSRRTFQRDPSPSSVRGSSRWQAAPGLRRCHRRCHRARHHRRRRQPHRRRRTVGAGAGPGGCRTCGRARQDDHSGPHRRARARQRRRRRVDCADDVVASSPISRMA